MKLLIVAHQVFIKRDHEAKLVMMVTKTTDDFLESGTKDSVAAFFKKMKERFSVGK